MPETVDGQLRVTWTDICLQGPQLNCKAKQHGCTRNWGYGDYQMVMPVPSRLQTWQDTSPRGANFAVTGNARWNAQGAGYYPLGGNDTYSTLTSFGVPVTPETGLNYLYAANLQEVINVLSAWGSVPAWFGVGGSTEDHRVPITTGPMSTPTMAVLGTEFSAALAQMTTDPADTGTATLAWLEANLDSWSWLDDSQSHEVAPIANGMAFRMYPHDGTPRYGAMVGTFIREPFGAPSWVRWRTPIHKGFDRGRSDSLITCVNRHVTGQGALFLGTGRERSNNPDVLNIFYSVEPLDGTPLTSSADLKALCGINAALSTTYGIKGLANYGPVSWSGAGNDGYAWIGPGSTGWQGRYPVDYPTQPADGVSRAKGFRMRVIAHDVDNGSTGTLPVATTTYADVDEMIEVGFVEVADVEFWPESRYGPPATSRVSVELLTVDLSMQSGIRLGAAGGVVQAGYDGGEIT